MANVRTEELFQVEYRYYQFNSGAADNGYYSRTRSCGTAEDAVSLAARINAAAAGELDGDEIDALADDLIPYAGTFEWAKAFHVKIESTLLT